MTNAMLARYMSQVFKPIRQAKIEEVKCARYASAMTSYTPSHRARHRELAWHAATKQAQEQLDHPDSALEAEDVLEGVAGSSNTSVGSANSMSTLNKSGSVAATNIPYVNGVSQRRDFSTASMQLRKEPTPITSRVSSNEIMKTDTTFASGSSSTQTTSSSPSTTTSSSRPSGSTSTREYSSKAEKTPEQKRLDDEEHRLAEGLVKGDNLMNQDEGMNANEDKEGMRMHPAHKHHSHSKRTENNNGGGLKGGKAYSTKAPQAEADKVVDDQTVKDRLGDRNVLRPESYEYTRSGTDGEMGDEPEAYCREHVHPEEELSKEQEMKKVWSIALIQYLIDTRLERERKRVL